MPMDPNNPFMTAASSYQAPGAPAGSMQSPYNDYAGSLGVGGGQGAMLNMLLSGLVSTQLGHIGMVPGKFASDMNWTDQMRNMKLMQDSMEAARIASTSDRFRDIQLARTGLMAFGAANSPETTRMANAIGGGMTNAAVMFGPMFPGLVDQSAGIQGRASVMAQQVMMGGRYQIDPGNQLSGYSATTAGNLASGLFNELYGTPDKVRQMKGISAGRLGEMYGEMSRRGMIGSESQSDFGVADGQIASPQVQQRMQDANIQKLKLKLKDMAGAVSAMTEIMGPGAPIDVIFNGLEIMTQGQAAHLGGARTEQLVRRMQAVASQTNTPIEQLVNMSAQSAGMARQLGLAPIFGVQATEQAMLFKQAWGQAGITPSFNGETADSAAANQVRRMVGAAASPMASNLAAIVNMADAGLGSRGGPLGKVAAAIKAGQTSVELNGQQVSLESIGADRNKIQQLAHESGISASTVTTNLGARAANQETIVRDKIAKTVTAFQPAEVARLERFNLAGTAMAQGLSRGISFAVSDVLQKAFASTPDELKDPQLRNEKAVEALKHSGIPGMASASPEKLRELVQASRVKLDDEYRTAGSQLSGVSTDLDSSRNQYFNPKVRQNLANAEKATAANDKARTDAAGMNTGTLISRGRDAIDAGLGPLGVIARAAGANMAPEQTADEKRIKSLLATKEAGGTLSPENEARVAQHRSSKAVADAKAGKTGAVGGASPEELINAAEMAKASKAKALAEHEEFLRHPDRAGKREAAAVEAKKQADSSWSWESLGKALGGGAESAELVAGPAKAPGVGKGGQGSSSGGAGGAMTLTGTLKLIGNDQVEISATTNDKGSVPTAAK